MLNVREIVWSLGLVLSVACVDGEKAGEETGSVEDSGGGDLTGGDGGADGGTDGGGKVACSGVGTLLWKGESGGNDHYEAYEATQILGMTDVRVVEDDAELAAALVDWTPALVVVDGAADVPEEESQALIQGLLDAGVPLIAGVTDLHREAETWGVLLGVTGVDQWDQRQVHPVSGASIDIFNGPSPVPSPLYGTNSTWAVDHHVLTLTGEGEFLAVFDSADGAEGAIALTMGGKVLVNGLFASAYQYVDVDEDDHNDGAEVFANEMAAMAGCE